jgi:hypothetical protein
MAASQIGNGFVEDEHRWTELKNGELDGRSEAGD